MLPVENRKSVLTEYVIYINGQIVLRVCDLFVFCVKEILLNRLQISQYRTLGSFYRIRGVRMKCRTRDVYGTAVMLGSLIISSRQMNSDYISIILKFTQMISVFSTKSSHKLSSKLHPHLHKLFQLQI